MFSHIPRRCLSAARDSKILQALLRYLLTVVQFPGLISLVLLCILYGVAEHMFVEWYFATEANGWWEHSAWKAAFPSSWRVIFLSLFVVPTLASLHLLWISLYHLVPAWQRRKYTPLTPFQHPATPHPFSFVRSLHFIVWLAVFCASLWVGLRYQQPVDIRYRPLIEKAVADPKMAGHANQEKIFIGAMFFNNEKVIPYWSDSIVKVIHYLGPDNVFVSIVESESSDASPALLQQLDDRLSAMQVQRRVLVGDQAVKKPHDMGGNNRIDFLAALRNRVLEPLVENGGYDKVVFTNDIFVEPESIVELLNTAEGEYDMVCGMDYNDFGLYDMWVLRDQRGRLASSLWPYFFDVEAREAMRSNSPVPVFTCWNGIVAFQADPLIPVHLRSNRTLINHLVQLPLPDTHPSANDASLHGLSPALRPPTRFRASSWRECYSSECFLLPYDFRRLFHMDRIFVNPRVVVGYDWRYYSYFKWFMRHPVLKWWIENVYDGAWMYKAVVVVGDPKRVSEWDGGDCHPWQW